MKNRVAAATAVRISVTVQPNARSVAPKTAGGSVRPGLAIGRSGPGAALPSGVATAVTRPIVGCDPWDQTERAVS
ncbi:hypothetical protein MTP03_09450 [Tsukamurella sp. PLM1]|nr:hypothetical protein MTP03_09450 [Tsukamurella sp. PLM1]